MTRAFQNQIGTFAAKVPLLLAALLLATVFAGAFATPSHGQSGTQTEKPKLIIGTMRVPPFVLRGDDGVWSGLSIELWQRVAAELKMESEFRAFDYDPEGLLDAVERHQVDVAVGAIPITVESEARFDFSYPYFPAGLGIAVRTEPQRGIFAILSSFLTYQMLATVVGLLGLLFLVGTLIWLLERRQTPPSFDPRPMQGIGDGVWWAAVTMTTTGYGDKVPVGWQGRILGLLWMFASIFCISIFSASLASSFVVNRLKTGINGPGDLPRARIATVAGSAGEEWVGLQGLNARTYPFVIQASKALRRGDVDALIYERAILGHMIKEYGWRELQILPQTLAVWDYAIAIPADSPIKEAVNRALLKVTKRQDWKDAVQRYVGTSDHTLAEKQ